MILHATMREGLMSRKRGRWVSDKRTGEMNLHFTMFFSTVSTKSTVKLMLDSLVNEYFHDNVEALMTLDEYFKKSKEYLEEKVQDKKCTVVNKKMLDVFLENYRYFGDHYGMKDDDSKTDKVIECMNKYKGVSMPFTFHYGEYSVLLDSRAICFCYENPGKNLEVRNFDKKDFFDRMFNGCMDAELKYRTTYEKLRKLGKNGHIEYIGMLWSVYSFLKFLNKNEDVEFGVWVNTKNDAKFLMLNQSDRFMVLVPRKFGDEDTMFAFKMEDLADEI